MCFVAKYQRRRRDIVNEFFLIYLYIFLKQPFLTDDDEEKEMIFFQFQFKYLSTFLKDASMNSVLP